MHASRLSILATLVLTGTAGAAPHRYDHVVVVVEENRTFGQIIGDTANAPYINSLATGGVSLGRIFAIQHPSQPNYLQFFSGSDQGVLDDNLPTNFSTTPTATYPFTTANLGREIINAGFTFAGYSEDLNAADTAVPPRDRADFDPHTATFPGLTYRRKHNPWANWVGKVTPLPANQLAGTTNKAFTQFPSDFTLLPTVSFIVPNQANDMHDGTRPAGDTWLNTNLNPYAQWAKTHNSLLIVTWDEDDYNATNQIPTVFYGASLRNGTIAGGTWTLHNLLRTLEDMYGSTTHAGSAASMRSIVGPFSDDPAVTNVSFRQGLNGYTGAKDTMLWAETPDANNNATQDLTADLDTTTVTAGNQEGQVLVRFDNLFGSAAGQIPAGALIHSAKLVLNTPDNITGSSYDSTSTYRAHRMIMDWTDTATWNSLTAGVSNNNTEAATTATYSLAPSVAGGPAIYDVTADLELFQSGTLNRGWLLRASTASPDDGWTMKSSEYATDVTLRPSLDVTYSLPGNTYTTWAASSGLTAANNAALLDPDHDGVLNLHEFAFNLNPLLPDATTLTPAGTKGLPAGALVPVTGGKSLEVTFLRRKAPTGTGLAYTAQFSPNLSTWSAGLTPTVTALSTDWERVTVRDSAAVGQPRRFGRVSVTFTP